eukprot:scaffold25464_cov113-Cylindrotheca_fusiformis.AAC.3
MVSLKARMAAFQNASSPEKFEQEKQKKQSMSPKRTGRSLSPPPNFLTNPSSSEKKKVVKGKVVENRVSPVRERPKDWTYLYELAIKYDQFKLEEAEAKKARANSPPPPSRDGEKENVAGPKTDIRSALEGVVGGNYTAKADWLNKEWVDQHLVENKQYKSLTFHFNDPKLFKKFTKTDEKNRDIIIGKFVAQLLGHPRSNEITGLDFSSCLMPDEFLVKMSEEVLKKPKTSLPQLQVLNLESNLLQGAGIVALAQMIRHDLSWKYLQILMLENQGKTMTSDAETALANAIGCSSSIVVCSIRVRGPLEKKEIEDTVAYNMDQLRQARREHASKTGTLKARKRNEMEQYFDKIAANDESITAVDLVGDVKFTSLKANEKTKSGAAFATNKHVKTLKMQKLGLDDSFAKELGAAIAKNSTLEKIVVDSNAISGEGIKALFAGLGQNSTLVEFQVRHQSKTMASADEDPLPDLLEPNNSIVKLGVDCRNQLIKMKLDKKTNANREHQRKMRVQAKKTAAS